MQAVYRFRWLLLELVLRDLTVRYRGSVLGFAWTLLNPVLFMGIYTLVFSVFLRNQIHEFPLFLLSGLIPWMWFAGGVGQATSSIIDGRAYVGKTLMPPEVLVLVPVLSNGINFLITIMLLFPVSIALGVNPAWAAVFLPALVAIQLCLMLGVALIVAAANVFFRDLQQVVGYALSAGFFLTPLFYAPESVPENLRFILVVNPFTGIVSAYRDVFYRGSVPNWSDLLFTALFAGTILLVGFAYFSRCRDALGEQV